MALSCSLASPISDDDSDESKDSSENVRMLLTSLGVD